LLGRCKYRALLPHAWPKGSAAAIEALLYTHIHFGAVFPNMASKQPAILNPTPEDISLLLAAQTHIGTKNCEKAMLPYVHKRRADGIHLINIGKTWEKIVFAARVLAAVENPADICVISGRTYGH